MKISRRKFLELCAGSSLCLWACGGRNAAGGSADGTSSGEGGAGGDTGAGANAPRVIWLQGSGCSGCSVSFLNLVADEEPEGAADVLLEIILLSYHPTVMAAAGSTAVTEALRVQSEGGYLLVVEGGVPTAFDGRACTIWDEEGEEATMADVVTRFAERAVATVCVGSCAAWGGVAAAAPNPAGIVGVGEATGVSTINVPGCPAHPDWLLWTLATFLSGAEIELDDQGRPSELFGTSVHSQCPRNGARRPRVFGEDQACLYNLGCLGEQTHAGCPVHQWNGGSNWCVDANAPCVGCTEPSFPVVGLNTIREQGGQGGPQQT